MHLLEQVQKYDFRSIGMAHSRPHTVGVGPTPNRADQSHCQGRSVRWLVTQPKKGTFDMKRMLMTALFAVALTLSTFTGASAASFSGSGMSGLITEPEPAPRPNCEGQLISSTAQERGGLGRAFEGRDLRAFQGFVRSVCSGELPSEP